jgi:hypothetical protein
MKNLIKILSVGLLFSGLLSSCKKDNDTATPAVIDYYSQQDHMGRPAINTVFIGADAKDKFNITPPSVMAGSFTSTIVAKLGAFGYTKNALGQDAAAFGGLLATDVLGANTVAPATTFYDGTNLLTGRNLTDDVIDVELLLIFGGADFKANPGLTSDNVTANDKSFLSTFPYMASPW